jgi:hypothetical protein
MWGQTGRFRHYVSGVEGAVEIESQWTARKREPLGVTPPLVHRDQNPRPFGKLRAGSVSAKDAETRTGHPRRVSGKGWASPHFIDPVCRVYMTNQCIQYWVQDIVVEFDEAGNGQAFASFLQFQCVRLWLQFRQCSRNTVALSLRSNKLNIRTDLSTDQFQWLPPSLYS